MTKAEEIKKLLQEEYGIKTEDELDAAMKKEPKLNIGVFVSPMVNVVQQAG